MPIKVNIKKLTAWSNDLADQIKVQKINEVAEDYAEEVRKALGTLKCPEHPRKISHITVVADRAHQITIEAKFCCPQFEKKVSLKIER